jgi:uncharacterized protein with beta-barrel porin domain
LATSGAHAQRALRANATTDAQLKIEDGGLTVETGSTLSLTLNATTVAALAAGDPVVTSVGDISLADGSKMELNNLSKITTADLDTFSVTLMTSEGTATVGTVDLTDKILASLYETKVEAGDDGQSVVLRAQQVKENIFLPDNPSPIDVDDELDPSNPSQQIENSTPENKNVSLPVNATAGACLLWNDRFEALDSTSILSEVFASAVEQKSSGDTTALIKTLAGLAGSTINSTGTSQRDSLRDELGSTRDRAIRVYKDGNQFGRHFWIEGNGSYKHLRTQVDKGGYKLSTWGGTFGADMEVNNDLAVGAAFTANYGDLRSQAGERSTGDLDSLYLNFFGHYQSKAWGHSLVITGTTTDASLDRNVDYGMGGYRTHGSTSGYGFGALYELTYDISLNDKETSFLQPLLAASFVHTQLDAYDESGAGSASLKVGKQEWTTGTVALGARWSGIFGTQTVGRTFFGELSATIGQDFGDKKGRTLVSLAGAPDYKQYVYGAKQGATSFQLGGSISTNISQNGTIYANAGVEVRNDANSVHANVGYRYSF